MVITFAQKKIESCLKSTGLRLKSAEKSAGRFALLRKVNIKARTRLQFSTPSNKRPYSLVLAVPKQVLAKAVFFLITILFNNQIFFIKMEQQQIAITIL